MYYLYSIVIKKRMKLLSSIDIFGSKFSFFIFNQPFIHTYFSSILTITMMFTTAFFIFLFGQDFFYRKNPSTIQSKATRNYVNAINLTLNDYIAAWRIEDSLGNAVDVTNILFPQFLHYDSDTQKYENLEMKKCSELNITNNETYNKLKYFNCFDWSNKNFGGSWEDQSIYYFSLGLYYCDPNFPEKCGDENKIKELLLNQLYLAVYYPHINFSPENNDNAYTVVYNQYYSMISSNLIKVDKIKVHHIVIQDDKHIVFNGYTNNSVWSTSTISSDYFFFDSVSKDESIYTVNFYMDKEYTLYRRKYVKLQEFLTIVSTFVKINYIVFKVLAIFYNRIIMYKKLTENCFTLSSFSANTSFQSKINLNMSNTCPSDVKFDNYIAKTLNLVINKKRSKKYENIVFDKWFSIKYIISCRRKSSYKISLYEKAKLKINNKLDILTYLQTIMEFDYIKSNLFTENQLKELSSIKKEVLTENKVKGNFMNKKTVSNSMNDNSTT